MFSRQTYHCRKTREEIEELEQKFNTYRNATPPNGGYKYWKKLYLSGRRRYAKGQTNRRIRAMYRRKFAVCDPEEIEALKCAEYEKEYDYPWTIW